MASWSTSARRRRGILCGWPEDKLFYYLISFYYLFCEKNGTLRAFTDCTKNVTIRGKNLFKYIPSHKTLFKQAKNKGLPIGNLSSQFFANLYLNELDQFIKHSLKCKYYLRYMDDLLFLHSDIRTLKMWEKDVSEFLEGKLGLSLNDAKTIIKPISSGVDCLGYIVRPFYILVRRRVVNNIKSKIYSGELNSKAYSSYLGHFKHANAYKLQKHIKILNKNQIKG